MALPNFEKNYNGEPKVLWSNSEPSANFAGQDITLSSSDYDLLEWVFNDNNSVSCSFKIAKGFGFVPTVLVGEGNGAYIGFRYRKIDRVSDTKYTVGDGKYKPVNSTNADSGTYNTVVKPLYVIGYKNKE